MTKYKNKWYDKHQISMGNIVNPKYFETEAEPEEYRGYLIYHRFPEIWDVVKNGVCVGQNAGPNGAKMKIDKLMDG